MFRWIDADWEDKNEEDDQRSVSVHIPVFADSVAELEEDLEISET